MEKRSPEVITCLMCGVRFERQPRGRRPKCCSHCTAIRRRLEYEAQPHTCGDCGTPVERRVVNGPFLKFCGPCAAQRKLLRNRARYKPRTPQPPAPHPCVECGVLITASGHHRCPECLRLRANAKVLATYHGRPDKDTRPCQDCGARFTFWAGHWTKRCEPCHAMWRLDLSRSKNVSRRMRLASVPYEFLSRARVFAEDGWICGLCEQPVDRTLWWPHPQSATLDHIVPVSKGGGHIRSNVQLAHALCNSRKGASSVIKLGEQQHG